MLDDVYFLPVSQTRAEAEAAQKAAVQEASARAIDAIADPRERELVEALDAALSQLGTADGYIPSIGALLTRRLQAALASYGVTPEYGSFGYRKSVRPKAA